MMRLVVWVPMLPPWYVIHDSTMSSLFGSLILCLLVFVFVCSSYMCVREKQRKREMKRGKRNGEREETWKEEKEKKQVYMYHALHLEARRQLWGVTALLPWWAGSLLTPLYSRKLAFSFSVILLSDSHPSFKSAGVTDAHYHGTLFQQGSHKLNLLAPTF